MENINKEKVGEKGNGETPRNPEMVDISKMTLKEIIVEFMNDEKYPDVETMIKAIPTYWRDVVRGIKRKEYAIVKLVEAIQKLRIEWKSIDYDGVLRERYEFPEEYYMLKEKVSRRGKK